MYGKDNIAMQRVFQVHIIQAQKSEKNFWKSAAEWNATGFPHWQGFSHTRSSPPVGWTRMSTLPLPGPSVLNECAQKQLDLSAERVAGVNTNSHAEVVSAGLQWAYEAPMEVHSLHSALYETHNCLRLSHTTFKRAWFTTFQHKVGQRSKVGQPGAHSPHPWQNPHLPQASTCLPAGNPKIWFLREKIKPQFLFGGNFILSSEGETHYKWQMAIWNLYMSQNLIKHLALATYSNTR